MLWEDALNTFKDTCFTVWLDTSVIDNNKNILKRHIDTNMGRMDQFTDADACVDFITNLKNVLIVLIISGDTAPTIDDTVVSTLSAFSCIQSMLLVHVIDGTPSIELLRFDRQTLDCTYTNSHQLQITAFVNDEDEQFTYRILKNDCMSTNKNRLTPGFVYMQLLRDSFCEMDSPLAMMIAFCRKECCGKESDLKLVEELQCHYAQRSPVHWYTRESFLYKKLNLALRNLDIETIVHLRRFIRDLHQELSRIHLDKSNEQSHPMVYRGVLMPTSKLLEFEQSQGCLMSINQFLSTTLSRELALIYAGVSNQDDHAVSIIFEISIPNQCNSATFASVGHLSHFEDSESEVLFSIGSIFRIDSVEPLDSEQHSYCVRLSLTDEGDPELEVLTNHFRSDLADLQGFEKLSQLLTDMGEYPLAMEIALLYVKPLTDGPSAGVFNRAMTYYVAGNHADANRLLLQGLELQRDTLLPGDPKLVRAYGLLAYINCASNQVDKALEYYQRFIELEHQPQALASAYGSIGRIYEEKEDFFNASVYYKKALDIRLLCLPPMHPQMATSYLRMGFVLTKQNSYSDAVVLLCKCLDIQQRSLPEYHPQIAETHFALGFTRTMKGEVQVAINHFDKAILISEKAFGSDHCQTRQYIRARDCIS